MSHVTLRKLLVGLTAASVALGSLVLAPAPRAQAATLLTDSFTGTTIDTSKWNEIDAAGAGGTAGNVQQNGTLTVANSFVTATWGATALVSADLFDRDTLEVQAVMTGVSDQLLGYGDYNFQSPGTKAYIIDLVAGGSVLALSWNNGGFGGSTSCGSHAAGQTWKLKVVSGGFEVYKNGALACTHSTGIVIDDSRVFLQSSAAASTFDDVLVTGIASGPFVPDAPTGLAADGGGSQAVLTWSAPASDGGSAITDYAVEYKRSASSTYATFADGVSATTGATVTGLTNGVSYDFRVAAVNAVGTGASSSVASATPSAPTVPAAPTIGTAVSGNAQATVPFTAGSTGGSAITGFTVTADPGGITATGTSSPLVVTGLTNGQAYTFSVTATNGVGTSPASSASNSVTPLALGVVLADSFAGTTIDTNKWNETDPSGLGGSAGTITQNGTLNVGGGYVGGEWGVAALSSVATFASTSLEISVTATSTAATLIGYGDYDFDETSSKAYILDLAGGQGSPIYALAWEGGSYTIDTCGTVTTGARYAMRVTQNGFSLYKDDVFLCAHTTTVRIHDAPVFLQAESSNNLLDDLSVYGMQTAITAPGAPTGVTAVAGSAQATVSFTPGATGGSPIIGYVVTADPGGATASGSSSPITVGGLTNGQAYVFTVRATNAAGTSSASLSSNQVTPMTMPAPQQVTGLTALGVNRQALLSWSAPASSSTITDYVVEHKRSADSSWTVFADGTSAATKAKVTGLDNAASYDFRVSAVSGAGTGSASAVATATPGPISNLAFVITGESNSGGIAPNSSATAPELAPRSSVQIMNLTSGLFGFEDLDIGTNNLRDHDGLSGYYANSHGLELQLANSVEAHVFPDNDQVYLVKTGHGGSQVAQWNVGGGYWTKFLERTAAAKAQVPAGRQWVVWLSLGINDSIANVPTSTWKTAMVAHINKIKAELPGAIVVMTEFQSMPAGSGYPAYNAVIRELAAEQPNVFSVDTTGAGTDGANHWLYAGMKQVGQSMVSVTRDQLGLTYPGKPLSLAATAGDGSVALSWAPPTGNGGSAVTDYAVEYKQSASSTYSTFADSVSAATGTTVTGLTNGRTYDFRVSSVTSAGTGEPALISGATDPDSDAPVISAPAIGTTSSSVTLSWLTDEPADTQVEYGIGTPDLASTTLDAALVTAHQQTISGLRSCTSYAFRLIATDGDANRGTSANQAFTTTCPGFEPPASFSTLPVTGVSGGTLSLAGSGETLTLGIPAGYGPDARFQAQQLDADAVLGAIDAPAGLAAAGGYLYNLTALTGVSSTIASFSQPITVTLTYDPAALDGMTAAELRIYRWDGSTWHALTGCVVNEGAHTVSCTTTAFSIFGIFGTPPAGTDGSRRSSGSSVQRQIRNLLSIGNVEKANALAGIAPGVSAPAATGTFSRDLMLGMTGDDVRALQAWLNANGFAVAATGPGSKGSETTMFGGATQAALSRYQVSKGIAPASGYFGPMTRASMSGTSAPSPDAVITDTVVSAPVPASMPTCCKFPRDLQLGMTGEDVRVLQEFLNAHGHPVAASGPGSDGEETTLFGPATQKALASFQAYKGIRPASGFFGPVTRAHVASM